MLVDLDQNDSEPRYIDIEVATPKFYQLANSSYIEN